MERAYPVDGVSASSELPAGELDVLVVGAGPTGLSLATQLSRYGTRYRLVDKLTDRSHESRAVAIQPRTLEVLDPVGVTGTLLARGNPAVRLDIHLGHRVRSVPLFDIGLADTAYPYLLFLSQSETEEALLATGVRAEMGVEVTGFTEDGAGIDATLRHPDGHIETVRTRYLAGCDGAHSFVRHHAGVPFSGHAYPQTFVLADVEADGIEPGAVHMFWSGPGILFFFPLGVPATWRMLAMRREQESAVELTLGEAQSIVDSYAGIPIRLRDPAWLTTFRLHARSATHYRYGRVFLAGDAAHIHSPAGGQGMNIGIQDAVNLGWKLGLVARGVADPDLLDSYASERAPVGAEVVRFTDRAFTVATSTNPLVRQIRGKVIPRVLPVAFRSATIRAAAFRGVSELAFEYRDSPLSVEGPDAPRGGPRAGDRLPDVEVDGTRLHKTVAASGFHLLLCGGPDDGWPEVAPRTALSVHRLGPVLGASEAAPAHYLVRPDTHIAYRAGGIDVSGALSHFDRWVHC
jgi:2-polyprenyl-6-methoxyphenol hydroxylase-like FAD-dependent oxidoreductase